MRGLLIHHAGGLGGSTWAFEWKGGTKDEAEEEGFRFGDHAFKVGEYVSVREEEEEEGFRFGDHAFRVGEYVSVREAEGELLTFRVVKVGKP